MGELIQEAGLNTLLGMGMTVLVLITLSLVISLFGRILGGGLGQAKRVSSKPAEPKREPVPVRSPYTGAQPVPSAEVMAVIAAAVADCESDDISPEIVAVIAAAVAAAEGKAGVSGFEVRKIRKSRRHIA